MTRRLLPIWIALVLAIGALLAPGATLRAAADPGPGGRGPEADGPTSGPQLQPAAAATPVDEPADLPMPESYPFQPELRVYPVNPNDARLTGKLTPYHALAPRLNDWMDRSDRISTQVVGESTEGRDLYLVTLTAPESPAETARQTAWRTKIRDNPAAAAKDQRLAREYKTPIWVSSNVHGNEWEGTDASLDYIEKLMNTKDPAMTKLLAKHRLYFSLSLNPDGGTAGTRQTALGLDPNRDMITNTTPETRSYIRSVRAVQALYAADIQGYTGVLQVEPCGPPHGDNYEYDLFIPHAYAAARQIERDVTAANIPGNTYYDVDTGEVVDRNTGSIRIPYRDIDSGWDDFPPVFTAQYAAFYGTIANTVELPKLRPNSRSQTPENAVINRAVALKTIESVVDYTSTNSAEMLANQIELFRRGVAGEPKTALTEDTVAAVPGPDEWKPLWDLADDQNPVDLPRAYVIPTGADQRSDSDAKRLVRQLIAHGIEVDQLEQEQRIAGVRYPAGSYVVDMRQPLRGLANALLDRGADISAKVPTMYDLSAWSYAYLWGADVAKAGRITDRWTAKTTRVTEPQRTGRINGAARQLTFPLNGPLAFRALNAVLDAGHSVSMLPEGTPVFGREALPALRTLWRTDDLSVNRASAKQVAMLKDPATRRLDRLRIGFTGTADDRFGLGELGFTDLVPLDARLVNDNPAVLDDVDALWIGGGLEFAADQGAGRDAVRRYLESGRPLLGRGLGAARAASGFGLLQAKAVPASEDSNGIVAVVNPVGSVLAATAQDSAFVYPAISFTDLGGGTRTQQSYGDGNPLLAGHWRGEGTTAPAYAAGKASVISGEAASGARSLVFGTSPMFRTHTKNQLGQVGAAIFWAAKG